MRFFLFFIFVLIASCSNNSVQQTTHKEDSTSEILPKPVLEKLDSNYADAADEMQKVWVLIGDTAQSYAQLDAEMYLWAGQLNWGIDTMERYYNRKKNALVVSENSEDEIYIGEYFPRRFGAETLSIEYLNTYSENTTDKTFALVLGIYDSEDEAIKALKKCIKVSKRSYVYVLPTQLYMGCMH